MEMTWGRGLVLPLAVALVFAALSQASDDQNYKCFEFTSNSNGTIIPRGDIVREVGHSYEAFCRFDPRYVRAEDVYLMHWGYTSEDKYRIKHEVLNESTIRVQITHQEAADYMLRCQTGNQTFLCERAVKVGYMPQDVENFTCISRNWESLNCTWTVPENPVRVDYILTYVVTGFLDTRKCPKAQRGVNQCFWDDENFSMRDEWVMTFKAKNKLIQEAVEFKHKISTFSSVIPKPPDKFEAKVIGPHEVNLTWKLPYPIDVFPGDVYQEVSYRLRQDGDQSEDVSWNLVKIWKVSPDRFESEVFSKTISNLYAYVQYDFRVRLHTGTGPIREHMWSDAAIRTERTNVTRPTKTPMTGIGTFGIEETLSHRDIYINWQKVDRLFWNGPDFHYNVTVFNNENNSPIKIPEGVDIRETYAKFPYMQKDIAYRFEIRPVNDEGPPVDEELKSVVVVPEMAAVLKSLSYFKVIIFSNPSSTVYSLRWRLPEDHQENQKIETVTLYWCKKIKYEAQCLNKLEWLTIKDPSINAKNLTDLENSSLYMFGISVNSNNSSSGIKWITCITNHGERSPPLEQFYVADVLPTEVKLNWGLDCKAKAAEPTGFNISYCIINENMDTCPSESEMMHEEVSDETADEYLIRNLHPFTNYSFNIAILTDNGPSTWSSSVQVQTKPDKPSGPPVNLNVTQKGQEWVVLSWEPPLLRERNGKIVKYLINSEPPLTHKTVKANTASNVTTYNITGLEPYTKYTFKVIPCVEGERLVYCGDVAANVSERTRIGVPGKIESIDQEDDHLEWEHEDCNGPACSYELHYRMNGSNHVYRVVSRQSAINLRDLNITCTDRQEDIIINMSAISKDEDGHVLTGPWKEKRITCSVPVMAWWIILIIASVCVVVTLIVLVVGAYGRVQIKEFLVNLNRMPVFPDGIGPDDDRDFHSQLRTTKGVIKPWYKNIQIPREKKISSSTTTSNTSEELDLIKPGNERQGRNFSGDSGTSEGDPGDSSGCSTGGESESSSGSDHVHQSSDSGTVQEEPGFFPDKKCSGSVRLRMPGSPNVRQGLPEKMSSMGGYVSVGSVPNLAGGMTEGILSLQQSSPSLALGTLPETPLGARRTSTGYISMPDNEGDPINLPLDVLGSLTLPHDGRQGVFPAYSRYNFSRKKTSTPDLSPYTKAESLPWLNTGYVAVAQAEGGARDASGAHGYVAVGDAVGIMKRQPSLPSLNFGTNKSLSTPDEELPPGAYCRVGARGSPGPPPGTSLGYVSITQDMPSQLTPTVPSSSPVNKSPYVTCAMAESIASPKKEPEKANGDYVSVGDMAIGRWADPVIPPHNIEESREVASAPVEGSRGRPSVPTRPNTSETNHNRGGNRWTPSGPSLSKQSSGYVSGNVSQETLAFHDPVVMSPKKLLVRSHEPHSVVYSPNHKPSMV